MGGGKFYLLLLSVLLCGLVANASYEIDTDVDLRSEFQPTQNQKDLGWCYAYTAADMLTHWLYKHHLTKNFSAPENQVSVTDIAVTQSMKAIGNHYSTLLAIKKQYGVAYAAMPEGDEKKKLETSIVSQIDLPQTGDYTSEGLKAALGGICFNSDVPTTVQVGQMQIPTGDILRRNLLRFYMSPRNSLEKSDAYLAQAAFPKLSLNEIENDLLGADEQNPFLKMTEQSCKRMTLAQPPEVHVEYRLTNGDRKNVFLAINTALDNGEPAEVSIDHAFLTRAAYRDDDTFDMHSMLVVGRRYNFTAHDYEYILRNSHGPSACQANRLTFSGNRLDDIQKGLIDAAAHQCHAKCEQPLNWFKSFASKETCEAACDDYENSAYLAVAPAPYSCDGDWYVVQLKEFATIPWEATYLK